MSASAALALAACLGARAAASPSATVRVLPDGYSIESGTRTVTWRRSVPALAGETVVREPAVAAELMRFLLERLERPAPPKTRDEKALEGLRRLGYMIR